MVFLRYLKIFSLLFTFESVFGIYNKSVIFRECGGDSEERGLQELLTIKDTWTKSRGRVEREEGDGFGWGGVEGWGEKAYNCN